MSVAILAAKLRNAGPPVCSCADPECGAWHKSAGFPAYKIAVPACREAGEAVPARSASPAPAR